MKALILAAGRGTRISRMIENVPKSTLPIDGVPLIRITIEKLIERDIEPIVCVGYRKDKIYEVLDGLPVKYYYNPFYQITNSIASLWFAREELNETVLILNADVFFVDEILDRVLMDHRENVMVIDKTKIETGDYFFSTTDNGCIIKYGKELPIEERTCEYVGIAKIEESFVGVFRKQLETMIDSQQEKRWWENVLYTLADTKNYEINTLDVDGLFWSEIDYFDDYERILNFINEGRKVKKNEKIHKR